MLNTAAKLKLFFSQFGLPAYTTQSVPEEVELPYISYLLVEPEWNEQTSMYCQIWYPKKRLEDLLTKADQVVEAIGECKKITMPGGYLVIYPSTPLIQIMSDDYSQSAYIMLSINAYHLPGQ